MKQMEFLISAKDVRISKGNLPQLSDEESGPKEGDMLQTAMDDADEDEVADPEEAVALEERRTRNEKEKRKQKKRKNDDNDELILSLLKKKIERKSESTRMGFFTSIMPRVDALDDEQFQEFQLQTLQLLKNLHTQKTQQQQFSFQSSVHSSESSQHSFIPIQSPHNSSMSTPSPIPSQSYNFPTYHNL